MSSNYFPFSSFKVKVIVGSRVWESFVLCWTHGTVDSSPCVHCLCLRLRPLTPALISSLFVHALHLRCLWFLSPLVASHSPSWFPSLLKPCVSRHPMSDRYVVCVVSTARFGLVVNHSFCLGSSAVFSARSLPLVCPQHRLSLPCLLTPLSLRVSPFGCFLPDRVVDSFQWMLTLSYRYRLLSAWSNGFYFVWSFCELLPIALPPELFLWELPSVNIAPGHWPSARAP